MTISHPALGEQFPDLAHQAETAEFGIWAFIATEVLFLGGLFVAYTFYRYLHPAGVAAAAAHTKIVIGGANTAILLTSSFFMSWASLAARAGDNRVCARVLAAAAALGTAFVALKGVEYAEEIGEHLWPGPSFSLDTVEPKAGEVFYFLYWLMTGIHALHLVIGIGAVAVIAWRTRRGDFSPAYHAPIRVVSLYWHFVDVVWVFLFALIYLPGRGM